MRLHHLVLAAFAMLLATATAGCSAAGDDGTGDDDPSADTELGEEADALSRPATFRLSDQVSMGRAPQNTETVEGMSDDFANPDADAQRAIGWAKEHEGDPRILYVGCIHAWMFDQDDLYRAHIHTMLQRIRAATNHPLLMYFEEENASHPPHPVSKSHAAQLRDVADMTHLACATYANGSDTRSTVREKVAHYRHWYHGELGVPMTSLLIDVDLSDTPDKSFYYGARGDLAQFNEVVKWSLGAAFRQGFGGFHTEGNVGGNYGVRRATDSTYNTLRRAAHKLEEAHPHVQFLGTD